MTLEAFYDLSVDEQVALVETEGVLIGRRAEAKYNILLFSIDAFYVEVWLRKANDTVWKIGGFDHPTLLDPYLNQINISHLLQ